MEWLRTVVVLILVTSCHCISVAGHFDANVNESPDRSLLVIIGAPGEVQFASRYQSAAENWREVSKRSGCAFELIDGTSLSENKTTDRDAVLDWVKACKSKERWVIYLGHGTSDKDTHKLNLRGPDLSADDLSKAFGDNNGHWLFVHGGACSAPWINALSGPDRIVITATKSGSEQNYARFGEFFAQAIIDHESDLDHDDSVSVLEAFLMASKRVSQFYVDEGRLATEQALLDDNGDKRGTPEAFYRGIHPVKAPAEGMKLDGILSSHTMIWNFGKSSELNQTEVDQLNLLEAEVDALRSKKNTLGEVEYLERLEAVVLKIVNLRGL